MRLEQPPVLLGAREVPGIHGFRVAAAAPQHLGDGGPDPAHVAAAAALGHEPPARPERPSHSFHHRPGILHPMQGCIAENGVELRLEGERLAVENARVESASPGRFHLRLAGVHADHLAAEGGELLGQDPVAATEVEDPLSGPGVEQRDHGHAEVGDEPRVPGVEVRVPRLPSHRWIPPEAARRNTSISRSVQARAVRADWAPMMMMGPRRTAVALLGLLALGVLVRGPLHAVTFHLPVSNDDAILLLMARHILKGELATTLWNQPYNGALDAYLLAPGLALGPQHAVYRLYELLCALLLVLLCGLLARRIGGPAAGGAGAALAAVGTPHMGLMTAPRPPPN